MILRAFYHLHHLTVTPRILHVMDDANVSGWVTLFASDSKKAPDWSFSGSRRRTMTHFTNYWPNSSRTTAQTKLRAQAANVEVNHSLTLKLLFGTFIFITPNGSNCDTSHQTWWRKSFQTQQHHVTLNPGFKHSLGDITATSKWNH